MGVVGAVGVSKGDSVVRTEGVVRAGDIETVEDIEGEGVCDFDTRKESVG